MNMTDGPLPPKVRFIAGIVIMMLTIEYYPRVVFEVSRQASLGWATAQQQLATPWPRR